MPWFSKQRDEALEAERAAREKASREFERKANEIMQKLMEETLKVGRDNG